MKEKDNTSYGKTLKTLTNAFENELGSQEKLNGEVIVSVTKNVVKQIITMDFDAEEKKAIAEACIEAASLIDPKTSNKVDAITKFKTGLDNELDYLINASSLRP